LSINPLTTGVDVATSNNFSGPLVTAPLDLSQRQTLTTGDTLHIGLVLILITGKKLLFFVNNY